MSTRPIPCRLHPALPPPSRPPSRPRVPCGCMESSMTASGSSPERRGHGCGSTVVLVNDLTRQFPLITETLARLRSRSCIIDGEAVACDETGIARFDRLRHHRVDATVFMYAFDLIELGGDDLRREPLEVRKATLASVLAKAGAGVRFCEHL